MQRPDLASNVHYQHVLNAFRGSHYSARAVYDLVLPIFVDTVFMALVEFCNTGIISSDGPASVGAVNTANAVHWLMFGTFNSIALGTCVLVAQHFGAGHREQIGRVTAAAVHGMLAVTVVYSALVLAFEDQVITLLFGAAQPDVFANIRVFLFGLLVSYPLRGFYTAVAGALRGIGRTKVTLALSVVANGSNMVLNVAFVMGLHMGVAGLAWSVVISQVLGAAMGVRLLRAYSTELHVTRAMLLHVDARRIGTVLSVSLPFILEDLFFNGGKLIIQMFIVPFGTLQLAANGIIGSWVHLIEIVPRTLCTAIVPIAGASLGARDVAYARKITRTFIITGSLVSAVMGLALAAVFPWALTSFYHADPATYGILWMLMWMNVVAYPLLFSAQSVLPGMLRAAGDGKWTTICSLSSMWIYRIGLGYFVSVTLNYQIVGLWAVWLTEWGVRTLLFYLRYRTGRWAQHDLVGRDA
ncbi:MATE family efflux transporter [Bifidobacterium sp. DSM 109958]|uniref:Probable multidrug resistance protein NorM n=1 Tax=Bifidobacterium moraviense TaxID=2675323 RepID=A0A7Y0F241_9BIFI|nr:MATE family efflux transporter [Bifidobacterium sp. DSM 109958]NMN00616.1 MATE family efflux transporter [Bifidobacterium sp. DSM 109958]